MGKKTKGREGERLAGGGDDGGHRLSGVKRRRKSPSTVAPIAFEDVDGRRRRRTLIAPLHVLVKKKREVCAVVSCNVLVKNGISRQLNFGEEEKKECIRI